MTFSKEDLSRAFNQVLSERVPDLSDIPDHVFSERFETRMNKLIRREAAHPWAVSHTTARNLLVAALIAILLFALSMSVSGIRNAIYHFFTRHFDTYDEVVFDDTKRDSIDYIYDISVLPDGYELTEIISNSIVVIRHYENEEGAYFNFRQKVPSSNRTGILDNEKTKMSVVETENQVLFYAYSDEIITLAWEKDGYEFWLEFLVPDFSLEQAIQIYKSIQ